MSKRRTQRTRRNPVHKKAKREQQLQLAEPVERVQRTWYVPWSDDGNSKLELSSPIETDTRHYCRQCKRKREERFMHVVGMAKFGKRSWQCADNFKICKSIHRAKLRLK